MYIELWAVLPGTVLYLSDTSSTPSRVVDVTRATHGVAAAYGARTLTVSTYCLATGYWGMPRPYTAWPDQSFRVEQHPEVWKTPGESENERLGKDRAAATA